MLLRQLGYPEAQPGAVRTAWLAEVGAWRAKRAENERLVAALDLDPDACSSAFQSRLGRTPWIQPYTDVRIPELAAQGVRHLAVLCPAFVADCLETVEEIGIRAREQWQACGGETLTLVPCLNAHPAWVEAVADMLRSRASQPQGT